MATSKVCMNDLCGASLAEDSSKKGWPVRSGDFANLCDKCGTAYEQLAFCDLFHSEDTGWRECTSCGKRLHCGCIASSSLLELLDSGGVSCVSCTNASGSHPNTSDEKPKEVGMSVENSVGETRSSSADNQLNGGNSDKIKLKQLGVGVDDNSQRPLNPSDTDTINMSRCHMKDQETVPPLGEAGTTSISSFNQVMIESAQTAKYDIYRDNKGVKDGCGSLVQTNLTIALAAPSGKPNFFPSTVVEERELSKTVSSFQQGTWSRHILPKTPKAIFAQGMDATASMNSQIRVARPPVEGRVRNQLLPRYWPRITEQELQQISGDSNSTIVPLFEKVLSASDAGRIGRLVLPKACAEAYFPPISQPEGLPLRIQDVKGKEWMFQFRFWPNNNSRMYVLEGVTPCIQSMQLQAGDTVTFSRMDPEGKLLMGFRKASTTISMQTLKGSTDSHLNVLSKLSSPSGDVNWHVNEKHGSKARDGSFLPSMLVPERKRSRNIGSKNKRLLIDGHDALELKHTWEELQDMLRAPASVKPNTVPVEDHEFEEYEEPPVLGKGSIFTVRLSGEQEQWAQCDNCSKWRKLPADCLLPPRWTCQENVWDLGRCSCTAPDELSPRELENLLKLAKDFQKRRVSANHRPERDHEFGLDTQNGATAIGDNMSEPGSTSVATTTKHPRHRPGCSCIVCIQPPSGKGKHKPTCTCNVCMTVKRRFKTLMLRKKKRQSEREAEIAQKSQFVWGPNEEAEVDSTSRRPTSSQVDPSEIESRPCSETGQGHLDLNIHPHREEDSRIGGSTHVSMMSLLQVANLPLETYLKQNGLTSLVAEQQASSGSHALPQATGESEGLNEDSLAPVVQEQKAGDEELGGPNQAQHNPS